MRRLLGLGKTELLVNLMWFSLAMHLKNPRVETAMDSLFGHPNWRAQPFMQLRSRDKEKEFIEYFSREVGARHCLPLAVPFSPEDQVRGGRERKKYYLIHFSNHRKAALIMKRVMTSARKELENVVNGPQLRLLPDDPDLPELRHLLLKRFQGREVNFEDIEVEMLNSPYVARDYRDVLKSMDGKEVVISRIESKKAGLGGNDRIKFL